MISKRREPLWLDSRVWLTDSDLDIESGSEGRREEVYSGRICVESREEHQD